VPVHVVSRGNNKQCIFGDAQDYEKYLALLADGLARFGVQCHAFCLLWNHLHLILRPHALPLWRLMQQVNSNYCRWFNVRHARVGHVLQGRYGGFLIEDGSYFLNALRYLALNPVVGGKVTRAEDWPWSSYRATMGLEPVPAALDVSPILSVFDAGDWTEARERFAAVVTAPDAVEALWGPVFAGSAALASRVETQLTGHRENTDFVYAERYATRPSLAALLVGKNVGPDLDAAVRVAFLRHGYTLREIGGALHIHQTTVWRWVTRAAWVAESDPVANGV
jgi:REP element-mobilizing transposase RayT